MKTLRNRRGGGGGEEGRERSRTEGEEEKKSKAYQSGRRRDKWEKKALARCFKPANSRSFRRRQMIPLNSYAAVAIVEN